MLSANGQQCGLILGNSVSQSAAGPRLPGALDLASSRRALACALSPANPKPPPFLEVFVCGADLPVARQVSGILRQTGNTAMFFA